MKISEAGPGDLRANPIHVREALKQLEEAGAVVPHRPSSPPGITLPTFYMPPDFSEGRATDLARRAEVLDLYTVFLRAAREDSGQTLERVVYRAALEARAAGQYLVVIGSPEHPPDAAVVLNDVPVGEALDLILVARDGLACLIRERAHWVCEMA